MIEAILIGLSLSMDAFAVSVSSGVSIPDLKKRYIIRAALFFGLFQFFMPLIGWKLGTGFASYIKTFDHWIAFGLLAFIGGKMIIEAFSKKGEASDDIRGLRTLLLLALATSIDALAVGISFSITGTRILAASGTIGAITFLVCLCGFGFGRLAGKFFRKGAQIAGGAVLVAIGVKILIEHLG